MVGFNSIGGDSSEPFEILILRRQGCPVYSVVLLAQP